MKVVFHDIIRCPSAREDPPNNVLFTLEQWSGNPCSWSDPNPATYLVSFQVGPLFSQAFLINQFNLDYFFVTLLQPTCIVSPIPNEAICADYQGTGGHMHYWWEPDDVPRILACDMALVTTPGALFDRTPAADGGQVIKLANPIDHSNILVKVSP